MGRVRWEVPISVGDSKQEPVRRGLDIKTIESDMDRLSIHLNVSIPNTRGREVEEMLYMGLREITREYFTRAGLHLSPCRSCGEQRLEAHDRHGTPVDDWHFCLGTIEIEGKKYHIKAKTETYYHEHEISARGKINSITPDKGVRR